MYWLKFQKHSEKVYAATIMWLMRNDNGNVMQRIVMEQWDHDEVGLQGIL
mgnify:CR=1 FL=1